jgi:hypothetical protein
MSSNTQKTKKRRKLRRKNLGKDAKAHRAKHGTPKFPIDPKQAGPDSAEKQPNA